VVIPEAEGNLVQLRQDLLPADDEREAIDGDLVTFQRLRTRHWNTSTPAGPSPHEMDDRSGITDTEGAASKDTAKGSPHNAVF
jgi:hypothetical protein